MAHKEMPIEGKRKIHYLHIDPKDIDINWLHSMRTPEEKKRDEETAEWFELRMRRIDSSATE